MLDLLLPDLTGQKLLIRWGKEGRRLPPIFVMSGVFRGSQQQEKTRAIVELAGWYEKPFDTRLLVEQLTRIAGVALVTRKAHRKAEPAVEKTDPTDPVKTVGDEDRPLIGTGDLEETTLADDEEEFEDSEYPTVIEGLSTGSTADDARDQLRTDLRHGDLSSTTLPSLLIAVFAAQETAEILFERNHQRKMIYFWRGRPVYATTNEREAKDTRSIVRSLFSWTAGAYVIGFKVDTNMPGQGSSGLSPAQLIVEGVREIFELGRLRSLLPPKLRPLPSPSSPFALYELPITDGEAQVLLRATGTRTVDAIARELTGRIGEREVLAVIYSLLTLGVLVDVRALP